MRQLTTQLRYERCRFNDTNSDIVKRPKRYFVVMLIKGNPLLSVGQVPVQVESARDKHVFLRS